MENTWQMALNAMPALVEHCALTNANKDMIIACPACGTRYAVPEAAIGSDGRTVRCAKCKHSWFQNPATLDLVLPADEAPVLQPEAATRKPVVPALVPEPEETGSVPAADEEAPVSARALRRGLQQPSDDQRVIPQMDAPAAVDEGTPPLAFPADPPLDDDSDDDEDGSQFDFRPPFTRRRNTLRMWTLAAALFAALATGTIVAVNYYGLPNWLPISRPTFGVGQPGLELDFPEADQRKETLASGETIFRVRGTITNSARESLAAPNLLVVFSDQRDRKVGDWVVVPAKRQLAPGETVTVTEAIANIPRGAAVADLGWAPN